MHTQRSVRNNTQRRQQQVTRREDDQIHLITTPTKHIHTCNDDVMKLYHWNEFMSHLQHGH